MGWRKKQRKIASEMHNHGRKIIEKCRKLLLSVITCSKTCKICMEDVCICGGMFTIDGCWHQYCCSCMKRYIEFKLSNEPNVPLCPHENCHTKLNKIDRYKSFLSFKAVNLLEERIMEDLVRVSDRIYCRYNDCSLLMKIGGSFNLLKNTKGSCKKCGRHFCIECRVPWHHGISCDTYRKQNPGTENDVKLKVLSIDKSWRQCPNCKHMIQQSWGCRFIMCRCDCTFCYICGLAADDVRCSCKG